MFESLKSILGPYSKGTGRITRRALASFEPRLINRNIGLSFAPIFIVSPPRSGSTLLYQLLTKCLVLCYFNNLMEYFPDSPAFIAYLTSKIGGNRPSYDFSSYYGMTKGWNAPSQGAYIWEKRWFPQEPCYVGSGILDEKARKEIRNTVAVIERVFGVPFVNKWPVNSVRIRAFSEVFPEIVFIRMRRDPVMIAQSILHGRKELWDDENRWMSTQPSNYEDLKSKSVIDQVCEQVFYVEKDIDADSRAVGEERFLTVKYEELCDSPLSTINDIKDFYAQRTSGYRLITRFGVPRQFKRSTKRKIAQGDFEYIQAHLKQLDEAHKKKGLS